MRGAQGDTWLIPQSCWQHQVLTLEAFKVSFDKKRYCACVVHRGTLGRYHNDIL